ncbi:hypothetical protein BP6252_10538 [Coleophoma cylindrospora]|uniref:Uncharacterized protein n=1 Tax=Coleophoma cylindrospora TaxID=1849047 RepID=A0A3D8QSX7_9HELO|nr:hypothetical protein BP6252_10538 [Coleophoma cylindrospora]
MQTPSEYSQNPEFRGPFTMLDLELFNHWLSATGQETFTEALKESDLFKTTFVELGFQNPFLMHEILSLSALHLAHITPQRAVEFTFASTTHHDLGLSLFQPMITQLSRENCDACFAFCSLLTVHTWATQNRTPDSDLLLLPQRSSEVLDTQHLQWMKLHKGNRAVLHVIWPWIGSGALAPLFRPWAGFQENAPVSLPPKEQAALDLVAESWRSEEIIPGHVKMTLEMTLHMLKSVCSLALMHNDISDHAATLAWMTLVPEEFILLVEDRVPEALLILANYCVMLKRLDSVWWCRGIADNLLRTLFKFLGGEMGKWERYLRWPIEEVMGTQGGNVDMDMGDRKEPRWNTSTLCPACIFAGTAICTHL